MIKFPVDIIRSLIFVFVIIAVGVALVFVSIEQEYKSRNYISKQFIESFSEYCADYVTFLKDAKKLPQPEATEVEIELKNLCKIKLNNNLDDSLTVNLFSKQFDAYQIKMNLLWEKVPPNPKDISHKGQVELLEKMRKKQHDFYIQVSFLKETIQKYNSVLENTGYSIINKVFYNRQKAPEINTGVSAIRADFKEKGLK